MSAFNRLIVTGLLVVIVVMGIQQSADSQVIGRGNARPEVRGVVKYVDATAGMITVLLSEGRAGGAERAVGVERSYPVTKTAEVVVGGSAGRGGYFVAKEAKLSDLTVGVTVVLTLTADQAVVESISAEGPVVRGQLKSIDAGNSTVTVSVAGSTRE